MPSAIPPRVTCLSHSGSCKAGTCGASCSTGSSALRPLVLVPASLSLLAAGGRHRRGPRPIDAECLDGPAPAERRSCLMGHARDSEAMALGASAWHAIAGGNIRKGCGRWAVYTTSQGRSTSPPRTRLAQEECLTEVNMFSKLHCGNCVVIWQASFDRWVCRPRTFALFHIAFQLSFGLRHIESSLVSTVQHVGRLHRNLGNPTTDPLLPRKPGETKAW